jgi:hypothetical protein
VSALSGVTSVPSTSASSSFMLLSITSCISVPDGQQVNSPAIARCGHVDLKGRDGSLRRELVQFRAGVPRPSDHMRAAGGERARPGAADATAGTSDDGGLSGEIDVHHAYRQYGAARPLAWINRRAVARGQATPSRARPGWPIHSGAGRHALYKSAPEFEAWRLRSII